MRSVVWWRNGRAGITEAAKLNLPTSNSKSVWDIRCLHRVSSTTALYWISLSIRNFAYRFIVFNSMPKGWYLLLVLCFYGAIGTRRSLHIFKKASRFWWKFSLVSAMMKTSPIIWTHLVSGISHRKIAWMAVEKHSNILQEEAQPCGKFLSN